MACVFPFQTVVSQLHTQLFEWWKKKGRILPWRARILSFELHYNKTQEPPNVSDSQVRERVFQSYFASSLQRDPYRVVVSEMMLQQTQVDRVLPKFEAWMKRWPQITDLAQAELAEVLIFWQGLGYNRRAKFLWLLAQEISEHRGGVWPTTEIELLSLPGIGRYTARAIQSFALGQHVGVVDTNIKRIIERVGGQTLKNEKHAFEVADQLLPKGDADPWNQALMDLGALICTARGPKCAECPVQQICQVNLTAQEQGYAHYAALLKEQLTQQAAAKKLLTTTGGVALKKVAFKDTDRYFRGRIMDELRAREFVVDELARTLRENYGLHDPSRFRRLLDGLLQEGMLRVEGGTVKIG